ncbi:hypothetical protein NEUTE1DRAFT_117988 [Neurospora tetrasperma FGSC 2508]|uniref:Secreted protein n=1 Tax=Neurospora tetrasperma (strain FGSC 2508 / ATCC MYA-4615 / P0657) TaxID=510951 RepID=F8MT23_NEUT8|nr:uncharacterized protein NEUTE1DRAFT_117988 [Neurospora tetrasperma FGSC 2508]EGO56005.1 hypothetical protein NEUTE1DRAFT_117988 [Neurospora tetrasperma FGSC 2508]EGZ68730.1 hypothetical protein NEUTE2DRAFT_145304 [Neurospora tetrasperma FGSC 2509]
MAITKASVHATLKWALITVLLYHYSSRCPVMYVICSFLQTEYVMMTSACDIPRFNLQIPYFAVSVSWLWATWRHSSGNEQFGNVQVTRSY